MYLSRVVCPPKLDQRCGIENQVGHENEFKSHKLHIQERSALVRRLMR